MIHFRCFSENNIWWYKYKYFEIYSGSYLFITLECQMFVFSKNLTDSEWTL